VTVPAFRAFSGRGSVRAVGEEARTGDGEGAGGKRKGEPRKMDWTYRGDVGRMVKKVVCNKSNPINPYGR